MYLNIKPVHRRAAAFLFLTVLISVAAYAGTADHGQKPLIVYYSRTGTTEAVVEALADTLGCENESLRSRTYRLGVGVLTCVLDQLLDREADIEPLNKKTDMYHQLIIASPLWIHRPASPVRTWINHSELQGKDVFMILTCNGNSSEDDDRQIRQWLASRGVRVRGIRKIVTKGKSGFDLQQEARAIVPALEAAFGTAVQPAEKLTQGH